MSSIIWKEIQVHWCPARVWVVRAIPFKGMHKVLDDLPTQRLARQVAELHAFGGRLQPQKALALKIFRKDGEVREIITKKPSEDMSSSEELVVSVAQNYCEAQPMPITIPTVGKAIKMLELEEPAQWWGSAHDVYEWALRLRDEIAESRNYMASQGRELHDEPVDTQSDYLGC